MCHADGAFRFDNRRSQSKELRSSRRSVGWSVGRSVHQKDADKTNGKLIRLNSYIVNKRHIALSPMQHHWSA